MPNLHRREFCSNLMAFSGGVFLSRPLGLALKSFIPRPSSLGDELLKEALSELGRVTDSQQRGELTRLLAPLFAPSDPKLAMSLLTEGLEEAEAQFSKLPNERQERVAEDCEGKPRIPDACRAVYKTLTHFPIDEWERSWQIAGGLGAGCRAESAILARAYTAGRLTLEDVRRSLTEDNFRQFLSGSLSSYPPQAKQVPQILAAVEANSSTLQKAETYSRFLRSWPVRCRPRMANLIRKEAVTLAKTGQLKGFVHDQFENAGLVKEDSVLAWDLLQMTEIGNEDLEWLMPNLPGIADNSAELHVSESFLADLKRKLEAQSEDCHSAERQLYLSHLMARVEGEAALRYAYAAVDSSES